MPDTAQPDAMLRELDPRSSNGRECIALGLAGLYLREQIAGQAEKMAEMTTQIMESEGRRISAVVALQDARAEIAALRAEVERLKGERDEARKERDGYDASRESLISVIEFRVKQNADLRAKLEAAQADTKRLDWLEASEGEVNTEMIEVDPNDYDGETVPGFACYAMPVVDGKRKTVSATHETLRGVIDASMRSLEPGRLVPE